MNKDLESLYTLCYRNLVMRSPILSSNMMSHIKVKSIAEKEIVIEIEAKYYDVYKFLKEKVIVYTGEIRGDGKTDYANDVNNFGGFFKHNKSENWVNRTIYDTVKVIAMKMGATIINELEM